MGASAFDLSTLQPVAPPAPPPFDLSTLKPIQATPPPERPITPPSTMAGVPGAPPGTPPPAQAVPKPEFDLGSMKPIPGPSNYVAAPNQPTPQERLGEMVPQAAVPALAATERALTYIPRTVGPPAGELATGFAATEPATAGQPIPPGPIRTTPEMVEKFQKERPIEAGITRGVAETAASTAADPLNWPFFGAGAARPLLQRVISLGFTGMLSKGALDAATDLHDNWDKMTPEQRAEKGSQAGLSALLAGAGAFHAVNPRLAVGITPEEVRVGVGANPLGTGPVGTTFSMRRGPAPVEPPPAGTTLEPPTIEGVQAEPKPVHHTTNDVEDLRASAERQAPVVGKAVEKATEGVPGADVEAVRKSKDTDRIEDKAARQGVQPSQIADISAAKVTVPDQAAAEQVVANLHKEMPVESATGAVTGEPGKNAVRQVQAIANTGVPGEPVKKAEVLLQTPEMHAATEKTHDDYRKAQELRAAGKEQEAVALEQKIAQTHEAADEAARQRQEAEGAIQKPSAAGVLQRPQEEAGVSGSERGRVEPSQQGKEVAAARPEAAGEKGVTRSILGTDEMKARIAELQGKLSTSAAAGPRAPRPLTEPESLKGQAVEVRGPDGNWKPGKVLADITAGANNGMRRLRGVFDDGTKFDNIKPQDVRKPQAAAGGAAVGVDFDGTLFKEKPDGSIGAPIPERIASLKQDVEAGKNVIIESRRAAQPQGIEQIHQALESVGLPRLPVTASKTAAPKLIDDKTQPVAGVAETKVKTDENTPLPKVAGTDTTKGVDRHAAALAQARVELGLKPGEIPSDFKGLSKYIATADRIERAMREAPKVAEPEHPGLVATHPQHTEMVPTETVSRYLNEHVQMVPTSELLKYQEQDRRAQPFGTPMDALKADIQKNGLQEALILKYGVEDQKAHITDGNHRLGVAKELGIKELPVRVVTARKTDNGYGVPVPGYKGEGVVPTDLKPSDIGIAGRPLKMEGAEAKVKAPERETEARVKALSEPIKAPKKAPQPPRRAVITTAAKERAAGTEINGVTGNATKLLTSEGERPAKYRVVEATELQTSHNAQSFAKNPTYPSGVQERAYDTSKEAQARVIQQAQKYDPNYTINTNPDAVNGPPIITPDGIVLGGNSRAMSTQRLYKAGDGNRYKNALLAQATTFGLDKEAIRKMKEPILVREITAPKTVDELRALGSELNKSMTGALGVSERAVSAGKAISRESLNSIAGMIDSLGDTASLRDAMRERGKDIVSLLVKDGAITARERPQFVDTATGGLSEEGKTFVERALLGSVVDDPRLMDATPKSVLNKLDSSLAALASLAPRTDAYNIMPLIRDALRDHAEIAQRSIPVEDYLNQPALFGGGRDPAVDAIVRTLAERPTLVKAKLRQFAQDANFDMPGQGTLALGTQPSPSEAFKAAFGLDISDEQLEDSIIKSAQSEPGAAHDRTIESKTQKGAGSLQQPTPGQASAGGQGRVEPNLFTSEVGTFEPAKLGEFAKKEFDAEILPALDKAKLTLGKAFSDLQHLIAPRAGIPIKTLDAAMKLTGTREKNRWVLEQTLKKSGEMFDKLGKEAGVAFVDAYKTGEKQPTPELQRLADFMGKTDEATYRTLVETQVANLSPKAQKLWSEMPNDAKAAFLHKIADFKADDKLPEGPLKELADGLLNYKQDHFRVLWKVVPGKPETSGTRGALGRRPLEGSKGFMKQATLDTMSEGLDRGGEPQTYNPVKMFELAQSDAWRYITAQEMWRDAKADGGRVFVKAGGQLPEGFKFIEDKIGNVRFPAASGEGFVQAGKWALRDDWHRLLSNMLSHDYIRESTIGNGLMTVKNQLTGYRLSLSPFHAIVTSVSSVAGQVGHGMEQAGYALRNQSLSNLIEAAKNIATSPFAPVMDYRLGTSVVRYATNPEEFLNATRGKDFILKYPEAAQLVDDLFSAGAKLSLHEDERLHSIEGVRQAVAEDRYIAALLKSPFALNQLVMRPLFGYYIPRIKLGAFLRDYSMALEDHQADLDAGKMTRGELARKTWDTTENIFGQMNWDARWWDRTFKAAIQLAFRAFTWFAGNVRLVKDAGIGQTKEAWESGKWWYEKMGGEAEPKPSTGPIPRVDPAFAKLVGLAAVYMGTNAAIQYAMTREGPKDAKDLIAARIGGVDVHGNPLRVVTPAIVAKDALSLWAHGAGSYMKAKESDLLSGLVDVIQNEDFRHAMVHNPKDGWWKQRYDDAAHILGSPIGISTYQRDTSGGESKAKAAFGLAGFSPAPAALDEGPLARALNELTAKSPGPVLTPEQRQKTDLEHRIIAALRTGDEKPLSKAIADRQLSPHEVHLLRLRAHKTPLEDRLTHVSADDIKELLKIEGITDQERRELHRSLRGKHVEHWQQ